MRATGSGATWWRRGSSTRRWSRTRSACSTTRTCAGRSRRWGGPLLPTRSPMPACTSQATSPRIATAAISRSTVAPRRRPIDRMPVGLVHGNPDSHLLWEPVEEYLADHADERSAVYLPGFATPAPEGFTATKEPYVEWLA